MDCVFGTYPTNDSHTTPNTSIFEFPLDFLQRFNEPGTSHEWSNPYVSHLPRRAPDDRPDGHAGERRAVSAVRAHRRRLCGVAGGAAAGAAGRSAGPGATCCARISSAGYFPVGALGTNGPNGGFNRTVTNLLGTPLVLTGGDQLIVNGKAVAGGGDYTMVANGTRLFWTSKLIRAVAHRRPGPIRNAGAAHRHFGPAHEHAAPTRPCGTTNERTPAPTATLAPPTATGLRRRRPRRLRQSSSPRLRRPACPSPGRVAARRISWPCLGWRWPCCWPVGCYAAG